jgi:hypothetical protein
LLIDIKDIIKGKIPLDNLPHPFLFLKDKNIEQLTEAKYIIAIRKGYRVVSHSVIPHGTCNVCMKKEHTKIEVTCQGVGKNTNYFFVLA